MILYNQIVKRYFTVCLTPIQKFDFILYREKDIDEKLARMDIDLKAWRSRVETRERNSQKERRKREQILKEVITFSFTTLLVGRDLPKCWVRHFIFSHP